MGAYGIKLSNDRTGVTIKDEELHRWIDLVRAAHAGDEDAVQLLTPSACYYIAERLADLIDRTEGVSEAAWT